MMVYLHTIPYVHFFAYTYMCEAAIIIFAHSSHRRRPLTYHIYVENNYAEFEGIQQYHTLYNYSIITYNKYNS